MTKKALKFLVIGGMSTLIDFCIYMLISKNIDVTISKIISMGIASVFSFIFNKSWTFTNDKNVTKKMIVLFYLGLAVNIAVNASVNTLVYSITNQKIISFVIATGVAMVVNFLIQNFIVFRNVEKKNTKNDYDFSIVFPCYNESENIEKLVAILKKFPKKYNVEFILVENGSTDNSKQLFKDIKDSRIKKVYVKENQGYGFGIISGLKEASGKYVGWLHSDLQYNPMELEAFFEKINQSSNEHILLKGRRLNRHLVEYIFTYFMGLYDSLLFRHHMKNVMAMPVIFNRELLKYIDDFPHDYTIDIFVYALAIKKGYEVLFEDVHLKDREGGKSSWNTGFSSRVKQSIKMIKGSKEIKRKMKEIDNE